MAWHSLLVWGVSSVPAMAYVYYGVLRLPRGLPRLTASLPLIAFYVYLPPGFGTVFERATYSLFFIWLTSFKIALLCWDSGPAADPWAVASFPRFLAVMNLSLQIRREKFSERSKSKPTLIKPIKELEDPDGSVVLNQDRISLATKRSGLQPENGVNGHGTRITDMTLTETINPQKRDWKHLLKAFDDSQEWHMVTLRLLVKFVLLMLICNSYSYRPSIPTPVLHIIYCGHMYVVCSLMFEGIAAVVSPVLGIDLEAAYNKPFLSHSLNDFWGRRWNLLISNLLRVSIYDPLFHFYWKMHSQGSSNHSGTKLSDGVHVEACEVKCNTFGVRDQLKETGLSVTPPFWMRAVCVFACFLVSGLMHELIFYYMNLTKPTWKGTAFFTLNGAATVLELAVRRRTRFRLPKYISTPLTLSFLLVTAAWLFFPALCDTGTDAIAIAEFQNFFGRLSAVIVPS